MNEQENKLRTKNIKLQEKINECKKAEKKLRESEERYKKLLEGTFDLVQSVKKDGSFMFVSDSWLSTLGYTKEQLRELSIFDIIHPRHLPFCSEMFSRVFLGEILKNIETSFISSDGREIILRGNAVPRYLDGKIIGTQGFFQDITEQRKLENELRLTQFAIDNSLDAAFWIDSNARFFYVNRGACKSLGFTKEELLSMTVHDIDPNFPKKVWRNHWKEIKKRRGGWVCKYSVDSIVDTLSHILKTPYDFENKKKNAIHTARLFSFETLEPKYKNFYNNILIK